MSAFIPETAANGGTDKAQVGDMAEGELEVCLLLLQHLFFQ
jgi:hypothetical protein